MMNIVVWKEAGEKMGDCRRERAESEWNYILCNDFEKKEEAGEVQMM
jgi:hypothetical protein